MLFGTKTKFQTCKIARTL